ncbi:MAG: oxygen-independent coproporphyrinogen III oxidase [Pseudomonadota bacterium]
MGASHANLLQKYSRPVPRYTSYPTAPHFHAGVGAATYRRWLAELPDAPLSLYCHIPFCDSLCWFCGCHTKIVRRYQPVSDYLEVLSSEIDLVADATGETRKLSHLHFGGGSPTMLRPSDIAALTGKLWDRFERACDLELAVEIDPRDMDREQVQTWAAHGMTRASLGVQDFNPEVQRAINRVQTLATTARVVEWLRAAGVAGINIDLMFGLPHQSVDHVLQTIEQVLELAPDRLALFGYAHVPWMKTHQRLIPSEALPGPGERLEQSEAAARRLIEAGYVPIGLDHFARPTDRLAQAAGEGTLHRNFQGYTNDRARTVIGLGASAIGGLPQGYVQNQVPLRDYAEAVRRGRLAACRGVTVTADDRLRRAVIERLMCSFQVDLAQTARDLGAPVQGFGDELAALSEMSRDGLAVVKGDQVTVTSLGRPFLRSICAIFDRYLQPDQARHSQAV